MLAGMAAALLAQGLAPVDACVLASALHARAARAAAKRLTSICVTAEDVVAAIPEAMRLVVVAPCRDRWAACGYYCDPAKIGRMCIAYLQRACEGLDILPAAGAAALVSTASAGVGGLPFRSRRLLGHLAFVSRMPPFTLHLGLSSSAPATFVIVRANESGWRFSERMRGVRHHGIGSTGT